MTEVMVPPKQFWDKFGTKSDLYNILVYDCKATTKILLI